MSEIVQVKKPRLEWLDALRGFTMILVVANHVAGMGFGMAPKMSSSMQFLIMFRMPLFFFVSGFLAYRAAQVWDLKNLGSLLTKKLRVQIIPTVVFFLFGAAILGKEFWPTVIDWIGRPLKGGKFKKSWIPIMLLFIVSLGFYETCYQPRYFSWAFGWRGLPNEFMDTSSISQLFLYFPFFLYGNIVHRYWNGAKKIMDSPWFFPMLIVVVIFAALDSLKWHTLRMTWFMYFRFYHQYFTKLTVMGRILQYIGRRTLDIYLIHYLFMPNLPTIGSFFNAYRHNFVLDTSLSFFLALLVIGFSIITSNILRISPFFKKWLFGRS